MPIFGAFETVGEPVQATDERGHLSTVWQARKTSAAENRLYAVKCYAARRGGGAAPVSEETLDADRNLEFLEGVKQWRKVQAEGGRGLAPVHDLGLTDQGAWYATDFYPRGSLKAWISRRGGVDSSALRHIIYSVVTACRALKQGRGCSHGNIKPANIFLVGKSRPLRKTPFVLNDPYPAAPLQLAQLDAGDQRVTGDLLQQVMEAQDLRALGELLLQLVEGRLVRNAYDYNYPIASSEGWQKLGKDGEHWRELCNRLLDPQLSIDTTNLDSLERELRPSAVASKLPVVLTAVGVACLIIVGGVLGVKKSRARREARFSALAGAASQAFAGHRYAEAESNAAAALKIKSRDGPMLEIQSWAGATNQALALAQQYRALTNRITGASAAQDFAGALSNVDLALKTWGSDPWLLQARSNTSRSRDEWQARSAEEKLFSSLTNSIERAIAEERFTEAETSIGQGASRWPQYQAIWNRNRSELAAAVKRANDRKADEQQFSALTNSIAKSIAGESFETAQNDINEGAKRWPQHQAIWSRNRSDLAAAVKRANDRKTDEQQFSTLTNSIAKAIAGESFEAAQNDINEGAKRWPQHQAIWNRSRSDLAAAVKRTNDRKTDEQQFSALTNSIAKAIAGESFEAAQNDINEGSKRWPQQQAIWSRSRTDLSAAVKRANDRKTDEQQFSALTNSITKAIAEESFETAQNDINEGVKRWPQHQVIWNRSRSDLAAAVKRANDRKTDEQQFSALTNSIAKAIAGESFEAAQNDINEGAKRWPQHQAIWSRNRSDLAAAVKRANDRKADEQQFSALTNSITKAIAEESFETAQNDINEGAKRWPQHQAIWSRNRSDLAAAVKRANDRKADEQQFSALTNSIAKAIAEESFETAQNDINEGAKRWPQREVIWNQSRARLVEAKQRADAAARLLAAQTNKIAGLIKDGKYEDALSSIQSADASMQTHAMVRSLKTLATALVAFRGGNYDEADRLCSAHRAESQFVQLGEEVKTERSALASATSSFDSGDYGFVGQLKPRPYSSKEPFRQLIQRGEKEQSLLNTLLELKNKQDWAGLLTRFKDPEISAIQKPQFQELLRDAQKNDPGRALRREFLILQVWVGAANKQVIDGKSYDKLPRGTLVSKLRERLEALLNAFDAAKVERPSAEEINSVRSALDHW